MISRKNYEIYFVDYFDGKLDESSKAELFTFLEQNSDLKEEFEQFEMIVSKPDEKVKFSNKESLKKDTPTLLNYKTWLVAELEGDLTTEQIKVLDGFTAKHPSIADERKLMSKIRLEATVIEFPRKKELKKPVIIPFRKMTITAVSVAAAITIFILGYLFIYRSPAPERMMSDVKKETKEIKDPVNVAETPSVEKTVDIPQPQIVRPNKNSVAQKNNINEIKPEQKSEEPLFANKIILNNDTTTAAIITPEPTEQVAVNQSNTDPIVENKDSEKITLADILDENELNELYNNEKSDNSLPAIALKEVERISGVSLKKNKNETSMTYALSVKKVFSITHTKGN